MNDDPQSWWKSNVDQADYSQPEAYSQRSTRFERSVRRRNIIETAAAILVIGLFGKDAIVAVQAGDWGAALAGGLVVAGALFIMRYLHGNGSNLAREPEADCRTYLIGQLERQRLLLKRVPQWYLAPLMPGILTAYGAAAVNIAQQRGWTDAIEGLWLSFALSVLFFGLVAGFNLMAANKLGRDIAALKATS